jgi:pyrimidine-specific ribonucleoside hydrolase
MGGSAGAGNITPVAEFNIWGDPEAAHRVLAGSGLDICLVGLDATRRATLDEHHLAVLREASRECALLADMITGYGDRGSDGWALHDALAIAAIVDPTLISTRTAAVEVDTGLGIGRAQTVCVFDGWSAVSASVPLDAPASLARSEVAVDLDVERFRQLLLDRITAGVVSNAGA